MLGGFGATFISRIAIEGDLAAGTVAIARVEGLEPARDVRLARASGRAETRVAQEFVSFARERLKSLSSRAGAWAAAGSVRRGRRVVAAARREPALGLARAAGGAVARWREVPSDRVGDAVAAAREADGVLAVGGGSAIDLGKAISAATGLPLVSVPTTYAGAEWTSYFGVAIPSGGCAAAAAARIRPRSSTSPS